jgi:hypothetical protein
MIKNQNSGQIGVIVLLIMVVLLTLGISVASRTTQDLFLAQQQVESTRVFNAAEAGIEQALASNFEFEGASFEGSLPNFGGTDIDVAYRIEKVNQLQSRLFEMAGVKIDVTSSIPGNTLDIKWSKDDDCGTQEIASLMVTSYSQTPEGARAYTQAYAGCDRSDGFTTADNINEDGLRRRVVMSIPDNTTFVKVTSIYTDTDVLISGGNWSLPVQSFAIRSQAQNNQGNEYRAVEVNRSLDSPPSILDYALFSGDSIIK